MSTTVRITSETHERLVALANATGQRLGAILEEAITDYEAKAFWDSFDAGYERLADDAERWAEVEDERAREAATLTDNLDDS